MEGKAPFWRSTTLKLMSVFLLVMLPLYTISVILTNYSSSQMKNEVEQANESKLNFYYSHLLFELQRMTALINEYSFDDALSSFSAHLPIMSGYDKVYQLNQIYAKLKQVKETSPYIEDVLYYVPETGTRVSAIDGIRDVPQEEWQSLLGTMGNLKGALSRSGSSLYLLRSNPFNLNPHELPNFLLGIRLSKQELQTKLKEFASEGGSDIDLQIGGTDGYLISSDPAHDGVRLQTFPELAPGDPGFKREYTQQAYRYSLFNQDYRFRLTASIPKRVLDMPIRIYSRWMWLLTALSVGLIVIFSSWSYRTIHRPLAVLIRGFRKAEQGQTGMYIQHSRKDEFGYLYSRFNEMLRRLQALIEENYVQRIRTSEAELKHLQSQITPHFLYNSLFNIKQMAEMENLELIKEFSDYLGRYFRYMTRDFAAETTLGQEVDHALVYFSIQKIRFGPRIGADLAELEERCRDIRVPRVLLQPFIENAFEHAFQEKGGTGVLRITYLYGEGDITIQIEDNGEHLDDIRLAELSQQLSSSRLESGETTGMINVNQRVRIKFGPAYGVRVSRSALGGLNVSVKLPTGGEGHV